MTIESIGDALITTDDTGRVSFLNPVAEQLTGRKAEEGIGLPLEQVFQTLDEETRELKEGPLAWPLNTTSGIERGSPCLLVGQDGQEFAIEYTAAPMRDGTDAPIGGVLVFRDVSAQRKLAQELSYQATHDELTGLVNRREFERRLTRVLDSADPGDPHALLYLDLDQFKVVNDQCGHTAGDELLRQIATILQSKIRTRDTLARLEGTNSASCLSTARWRRPSALPTTFGNSSRVFALPGMTRALPSR